MSNWNLLNNDHNDIMLVHVMRVKSSFRYALLPANCNQTCGQFKLNSTQKNKFAIQTNYDFLKPASVLNCCLNAGSVGSDVTLHVIVFQKRHDRRWSNDRIVIGPVFKWNVRLKILRKNGVPDQISQSMSLISSH